MKTRRSILCGLFMGLTCFAISLFIGAGQAGAESIYRHLYNNTKDMIEFYVDADLGNVYFETGPCNGIKNGPCLLPAGATQKYQFTETNGEASGAMNIFCKTCKNATWVKLRYSASYNKGWYATSGSFKGGEATGYHGQADVTYWPNTYGGLDILVSAEVK